MPGFIAPERNRVSELEREGERVVINRREIPRGICAAEEDIFLSLSLSLSFSRARGIAGRSIDFFRDWPAPVSPAASDRLDRSATLRPLSSIPRRGFRISGSPGLESGFTLETGLSPLFPSAFHRLRPERRSDADLRVHSRGALASIVEFYPRLAKAPRALGLSLRVLGYREAARRFLR
jgi:hypothetical protein